jgi:hypothetical protein
VSAAVVISAVLALALLDGVVTLRIVRSDAIAPGQKVAWLCFVWLVPLVGALFGLQISSDSQASARPDGALDAEAPLTPGLHIAGRSYIGGGGPADAPADPSFRSDS